MGSELSAIIVRGDDSGDLNFASVSFDVIQVVGFGLQAHREP